MKRILIVDDDRKANDELRDLLNATKEYAVAGQAFGGSEALAMAERCKPDAVILDLVMPELDGLAVLERWKAAGKDFNVLMVSAFGAEKIVTKALQLGARYYLMKPFAEDVLLKRLGDIFAGERALPDTGAARKLDERISNIFITVGIPPHIKGYGYLREGVKMAMQTPGIINHITKKLYPKIGEKYETSASKVERAIRHAIEVAWNRGRIETINALFGVRAYVGNEKPTNGEFIALVADKMLLEGMGV